MPQKNLVKQVLPMLLVLFQRLTLTRHEKLSNIFSTSIRRNVRSVPAHLVRVREWIQPCYGGGRRGSAEFWKGQYRAAVSSAEEEKNQTVWKFDIAVTICNFLFHVQSVLHAQAPPPSLRFPPPPCCPLHFLTSRQENDLVQDCRQLPQLLQRLEMEPRERFVLGRRLETKHKKLFFQMNRFKIQFHSKFTQRTLQLLGKLKKGNSLFQTWLSKPCLLFFSWFFTYVSWVHSLEEEMNCRWL